MDGKVEVAETEGEEAEEAEEDGKREEKGEFRFNLIGRAAVNRGRRRGACAAAVRPWTASSTRRRRRRGGRGGVRCRRDAQ